MFLTTHPRSVLFLTTHPWSLLYATRFDLPTIMTMQWICKLVEPHCHSQPLPAIPVALFYSLSFLSVLFLTCLTVKLSILLSTDDIMALGFCCMCGRLRWTPHRSTRNKKQQNKKKNPLKYFSRRLAKRFVGQRCHCEFRCSTDCTSKNKNQPKQEAR